jgi:serine/threonine protein kinase
MAGRRIPLMVDWEGFYSEFRSADFVPGYEILERLGGGAFGEVYKARKRSIGKDYAIKFLKVGDEQSAAIIERELSHARLFAAIDHPHLVAIEDLGQVRGVPYVVMGYAGEETLSRRLARAGFDGRGAFETFVQVCRGVQALHDRQLVHFDLKPSNVFLRGDVARVGDYGLAKLLTDGRQTLSIGRGTPHYMAPEVLRGRADQRADIYSLGVILYEVFAGRVPFDGDSGLTALLRGEDRRLQFPEHFPTALRPLAERCLRVDPDGRPQTVAQLLAELGVSARVGDSIELPADLAHWRPESARQESELRTPTPWTAAGGEVVEWETLEGASRAAPSVARPAAPAAVRAATPIDVAAAAAAPRNAASGVAPPGPAPAFVGGAVAAPAIPVPPRHEGGTLAQVWAVLVVGFELYLGLVHVPVAAALGLGTRGVGSALRGVAGLVRWALFSFLLGGAVALLLLFVLWQ